MAFTQPRYLVSTDWLAANLDDPSLRILDATVFLRPPSPDAPRTAWVRESGRKQWEAGHIPGSAFADLIHDLSDQAAELPFMLPPAAQFAAAMGALGVGPGTRVICYDAAGTMWAARLWWMLRTYGFDDVAVLDGGWKKWTLEGRPVSTDPPSCPPATFQAVLRPGFVATREDVLAAIGDGAACIVNALAPEQHRGDGPAVYGRPGRIASSVNVPARDLTDPETGAFLPAGVLRERFADVGATGAGRVITYCGGGIAATADALVLALLGHENVAVYDGSMSEWGRDPSLPMEVG
jgi:thiosulfate/3-mercaptopyruvate sulfurtransferase